MVFKMFMSQKKKKRLKHFRQFKYLSSAFYVENIVHVSTSAKKYSLLPFSRHRINIWKIIYLMWRRRAKFMLEMMHSGGGMGGSWTLKEGHEWDRKTERGGKLTSGSLETWLYWALWTSEGIRWDPGYRRCFGINSGPIINGQLSRFSWVSPSIMQW